MRAITVTKHVKLSQDLQTKIHADSFAIEEKKI